MSLSEVNARSNSRSGTISENLATVQRKKRHALYRQSGFYLALKKVVDRLEEFREAMDELNEHEPDECVLTWADAGLPDNEEAEVFLEEVQEMSKFVYGLGWSIDHLSGILYSHIPLVPPVGKDLQLITELNDAEATACAIVGGKDGE